MKELSPQQQGVYDFIWQYNEEKEICPAIEDIAEGLGLSNSTVATYVETLKQKGYVTCDYGIPRSLRAIST
jgi:Mn-dependent DtxR family transcriptional regulator